MSTPSKQCRASCRHFTRATAILKIRQLKIIELAGPGKGCARILAGLLLAKPIRVHPWREEVVAFLTRKWLQKRD